MNQSRGQPAAGLADHVPRADGGQQGAGLLGGQILLGATSDEFEQQGVQSVDEVGAGAAKVVIVVPATPTPSTCARDRYRRTNSHAAVASFLCLARGGLMFVRRFVFLAGGCGQGGCV